MNSLLSRIYNTTHYDYIEYILTLSLTWYCILSFCYHIITSVYVNMLLLRSFCLQGFNLYLSTGRQREETLTLLECELLRSRRSLDFLLLASVNKH